MNRENTPMFVRFPGIGEACGGFLLLSLNLTVGRGIGKFSPLEGFKNRFSTTDFFFTKELTSRKKVKPGGTRTYANSNNFFPTYSIYLLNCVDYFLFFNWMISIT